DPKKDLIEEEPLKELKEERELKESRKEADCQMLVAGLDMRSRVTLAKAKSNPSEAEHSTDESYVLLLVRSVFE
nr:hypothetical protein [Tanacetum cinerariifolium]